MTCEDREYSEWIENCNDFDDQDLYWKVPMRIHNSDAETDAALAEQDGERYRD